MSPDLTLQAAQHWSNPTRLELAELRARIRDLETRLRQSNEVVRGIAVDAGKLERERIAQLVERLRGPMYPPALAAQIRLLPDREG